MIKNKLLVVFLTLFGYSPNQKRAYTELAMTISYGLIGYITASFVIFCSVVIPFINYREFVVQTENYVFYFDPVPHKTKRTVHKIPRCSVIQITKHISKQKRGKYPFVHCTGDLRNYLTNEEEACIDRRLELNSRILHTKHYTLKNVIGNMYGSWSIGTTYVRVPKIDYHFFRWPEMYNCRKGFIRAHFHEVILTGHLHSRFNFGHCLTDLIAPILLLPKDVRERSYVIGSPNISFPNELLRIIGFKDEQIIQLNETSWFYADKLHAFSQWRPLANINGDMNVILNKVLIEKLNLSHITPTKYTINNRKGKRGIKNIDELLAAIQQRFPEKQWNVFYTYGGNISSYAYQYTEVKFLIAPVGSNVFNMVFMKPYTILCIGSSERFDYYSVFFAVSSYHYYYMFPVPGLQHRSPTDWEWNISIALKAIGNALYCEKYKHFPYITKFGGLELDVREEKKKH